MTRWWIPIVLVAWLAPGAVALAQDDPEALARVRFEAGRAAFDAGHYEDALRDFRRAHELSGRPELLYNIGSSAERLARDAEAVEAYRAFVAAVPEHPARAEAERRIVVLEARLRATERGEPPPPDDVQPEPEPQPEPAVAAASGGWLVSWVALGLTAASGAGIGVAWALANDAYGSLEASCRARGCDESQIAASEVQARLDATTAMWVVTGLLAAATVTLFVLEAPGVLGGAEAEVAVGPGRVELRGSF